MPFLPVPLDPNPYQTSWPAGYYTINARINPPTPPYIEVPGRHRPIKPPLFKRTIRVSPS
jgi:hypothetical protein